MPGKWTARMLKKFNEDNDMPVFWSRIGSTQGLVVTQSQGRTMIESVDEMGYLCVHTVNDDEVRKLRDALIEITGR